MTNFIPLQIAILTVSDTRNESNDRSGQLLFELATGDGHVVAERAIVSDDQSAITERVLKWIDDPQIDVVIASGGTGVTGRDVTPEAFESLFEKHITGFGELFRWLSYSKIGPSAIQSRATAGLTKGTYLFAVPGSLSACQDAWEMILRHQLDNRSKPCSLSSLMPRLQQKNL